MRSSGLARLLLPRASAPLRCESGQGDAGVVDPSAALQLLRDALVRVRFPLQTSGAEAAEDVRDAMVDQLDDYILPRLARLGRVS